MCYLYTIQPWVVVSWLVQKLETSLCHWILILTDVHDGGYDYYSLSVKYVTSRIKVLNMDTFCFLKSPRFFIYRKSDARKYLGVGPNTDDTHIP